MATKGKAADKAAKETKQTKAAKAEEAAVTHVKFLGYGDEVPEDERFLETDSVYQVVSVGDDGVYVVQAANPDFDSSKKVNAKTNPETIEVECFAEEVEVVDAPESAAEKPPVTAKESTKVKAGKAPAPAKAAKEPKAPKVKAEAAPEEAEDGEVLPTLTEDQEDAEVIAMVKEADGIDGLVGLTQELEGAIATNEFRIGGLLYHIKKTGGYKTMDDGAFAGKGGWAEFLKAYSNVEYRKAQYLIDIYVAFGQSGLPNPAERVAKIGWTKASVLVKPLQEGGDVEDLVKLAEENTVSDLRSTIEEQKVNVGAGSTNAPTATRVTMKFRFFEEKATQLTEILAAVKDAQGFTDVGEALDFILTDWAATNGGAAAEDKAPAQTAPAKAKTTAKAAAKPSASKPRAAAAAA